MDTNTQQNQTPKMTEEQLDVILDTLQKSPLCCRCGATIQGAPRMTTIQCPGCGNHMRHVGDIWMHYVSPLDLSVSAPKPGGRHFGFTK